MSLLFLTSSHSFVGEGVKMRDLFFFFTLKHSLNILLYFFLTLSPSLNKLLFFFLTLSPSLNKLLFSLLTLSYSSNKLLFFFPTLCHRLNILLLFFPTLCHRLNILLLFFHFWLSFELQFEQIALLLLLTHFESQFEHMIRSHFLLGSRWRTCSLVRTWRLGPSPSSPSPRGRRTTWASGPVRSRDYSIE